MHASLLLYPVNNQQSCTAWIYLHPTYFQFIQFILSEYILSNHPARIFCILITSIHERKEMFRVWNDKGE